MRLTIATTSEGSITLVGTDGRNPFLANMSFFSACDCTANQLGRVERRGWMRLFSQRRLYKCASCRKLQLLPEEAVNRAKAAYASREAMPDRRPRSAAA